MPKMTKQDINYQTLTKKDFANILVLAKQVHGAGYLNNTQMHEWYEKGILNDINSSYVAYHDDKLVGFRISYSPNSWQIDKWYSPTLWRVQLENTAYFKCNTVDEHYRGLGIGSKLLHLSIAALKQQGAKAGVSHLWRQSPGNSAVKYFTKCGGQLVKSHPDKWHEDSLNGYECTICGFDCHCEAAEMIIYFQ